MGNLLARLRTPPSETYTKVTFPEGFTVDQIAARLDRDMPTMTAADVLAAAADPSLVADAAPAGVTSLEGLLFPDTYQVSNGETPAHVLGRMVGADGARRRPGGHRRPRRQRLGRTPYEILIIASLIEREAKTDADRAEDRPRHLQPPRHGHAARRSTPRVLLRHASGRRRPDAIPFDQQRQTPGPYNTYLNTGLPPTPIANPGRASIRAALNPAPNPSVGDPLCAGLPEGTPCEYLYYVLADEDGNHAFAVTAEQHQANVARGQRRRRRSD